MARRKHEEEPENHERWMVSYADFITLLFAFFVVMYAISSVNEGKYRVLSDSLGSAFGTGALTPVPQTREHVLTPLPRPRQTAAQRLQAETVRRERAAMSQIASRIQQALAPLVRRGIVRVTQTSTGVKVEINASILFAPGDATLSEESGEALVAIAEILKDDTHGLRVEGHTDNVPINNAIFPSNWELSSARASSVVRLLVDSGVAQSRLTAIGHADNFPVGPNEMPDGRLRNRRVEIMILASVPETPVEVPLAPVTEEAAGEGGQAAVAAPDTSGGRAAR